MDTGWSKFFGLWESCRWSHMILKEDIGKRPFLRLSTDGLWWLWTGQDSTESPPWNSERSALSVCMQEGQCLLYSKKKKKQVEEHSTVSMSHLNSWLAWLLALQPLSRLSPAPSSLGWCALQEENTDNCMREHLVHHQRLQSFKVLSNNYWALTWWNVIPDFNHKLRSLVCQQVYLGASWRNPTRRCPTSKYPTYTFFWSLI